MPNQIKGEITGRSKWVIFLLAGLAMIVGFKILSYQKGDNAARIEEERQLVKEQTKRGSRGNIYACDGKSLLATSIPIYELAIDPSQAKDKLFNAEVDSLCIALSKFDKRKSKNYFKRKILDARERKSQYLRLISRDISHEEKNLVRRFPLLRHGKYKGGLLLDNDIKRFRPFGSLARKTIGGLTKNKGSEKGIYGIEASFQEYLAGNVVNEKYQRLPGGYPKAIKYAQSKEASSGKDIITTIDINYQDIVETALRKQVEATQAQYGSAIVMETASGEIKAIANLTKKIHNGKPTYLEVENHAVVGRTDPGSTFKLATMLALLDESSLKPTDFAVDCKGLMRHNKKDNFTCSKSHGNLTVQEVFEYSCNVGIYKLIERVFNLKNYKDYREYLSKFRLDQATGVQLIGELLPYIKKNDDKTFSNTTFPWTSIGYECSISPLQMLTFYNAVANDGYWVQPLLVKEIKEGNETIKTFTANKINKRIASKKSILMVQEMLKGVTEKGTAKGIKKGFCKVAGKTGTTQKQGKGTYQNDKHYASFIGYFPAEEPKYTCLVVIDDPRGSNIYGGAASAPVFRKIADNIFSSDVNVHPSHPNNTLPINLAQIKKGGYVNDLKEISKVLSNEANEWKETNGLIGTNGELQTLDVSAKIPDITGLVLRDVLPLLENKGYVVKYKGTGKVQSYEEIRPGYLSLKLQ